MRHILFSFFLAVVLFSGAAHAQVLVQYDIRNLSAAAWTGTKWPASPSTSGNVTRGEIFARKGSTVYDSSWWGYKSENMWLINWPQTLNMGQDYYEFTITAASGYRLNLTGIDVGVAREAYDIFLPGAAQKGAQTYRLYTSIGGYDANNHIAQLQLPNAQSVIENQRIDQGVLSATLGAQYSGIPSVTFRVYGYKDSTADGGGGIANFAGTFQHRTANYEPWVPYTVAGTGSNVIIRGTVNYVGGSLASHLVSTTTTGSGSITPTSQNVSHGSTTSLTVTPSSGNAISSVTGCGGTLLGNTYSTAAITAPCTVTATFGNYRTVNASAGTGGKVDPTVQSVLPGSKAGFTVTPNYGFSHSKPPGGNCPAGTWSGNTYTTGSISNNCSVYFYFSQEGHAVSATAGPNGSVTPSSRTVTHGSTASFTVTPASGYLHGSVGGDCPTGSRSGNTYTTGPITSPCAVSFSFTQDKHTVSSSAGTNGSVTPLGSLQVGHGSTISYTVTPAGGYLHGPVSVARDDEDCRGTFDGNIYTTSPITTNCSLGFSFTRDTRTVTAGVIGSGGTVSPGSSQVGVGATASFTVTPENSQYYQGPVSGTCPSGSWNGNTYTTGAVSSNCSVSFSFVTGQRIAVVSAGEDGIITPGSRTVGVGSTASFSVVPDSGYTHRPMGGTCPPGSFSGNTYTTGPITSNCTVNATFTRLRKSLPGVILLLLDD